MAARIGYALLLRAIGLLALTVTRLSAVPLGIATFPHLTGNITFHPTNGFGTFATGVLSNLTCNNPIGNFLPGNPLIGNSSVPCRVAMTIHNVANTTGVRNSDDKAESRQLPFDWDQIFGGGSTAAPNDGGNSQCDNVGSLFNPTNSPLNPLGFLGNMEVFNRTGRFTAGPFNFTLDSLPNPLSVLNLPVVIWREALNDTLALVNQFNPVRILSCAFIRLTHL